MSDTARIRTFIGANSVKGSLSHRETLYDPLKTNRAVLIKGGAGNGKSTLMSRIALAAEGKGYGVERVYCPSDPKSLDGIVCRELGFAMTDATPPHVAEPTVHCLPEVYLSLSSYVSDEVVKRKGEIIALNEELKNARKEADKCIKAAYEADSELLAEVLTYADTGGLCKSGRGLAKKYLPKGLRGSGEGSKMKRRFLSAIAPDSLAAFPETPYALCGQNAVTVALRDELGLSPFVLGSVCEEAERLGFELWGFFDPLVISRMVGVCIPEAGLCFLPEEFARNPAEILDTGAGISQKGREELGAKPEVLLSVRKALTDGSCEKLSLCLALHDKIEAEYRPYTDFSGLEALGEELCEKYVP